MSFLQIEVLNLEPTVIEVLDGLEIWISRYLQ